MISALSGLGLDRTQVVLVADPAATGNVLVTAVGDFGSLSLRLENRPLTNQILEMTALSLVKARRGHRRAAAAVTARNRDAKTPAREDRRQLPVGSAQIVMRWETFLTTM